MARVTAEHVLNEANSYMVISPQLLMHLGQMVHMDDVRNDEWSLGCLLHHMSTCTNKQWRFTFCPWGVPAFCHQMAGLNMEQRMPLLVQALLLEQKKMVGSSHHQASP